MVPKDSSPELVPNLAKSTLKKAGHEPSDVIFVVKGQSERIRYNGGPGGGICRMQSPNPCDLNLGPLHRRALCSHARNPSPSCVDGICHPKSWELQGTCQPVHTDSELRAHSDMISPPTRHHKGTAQRYVCRMAQGARSYCTHLAPNQLHNPPDMLCKSAL